jgi:hypothetical protein
MAAVIDRCGDGCEVPHPTARGIVSALSGVELEPLEITLPGNTPLQHLPPQATMDQKLAQLSALNQKDKGTSYLSLLSNIFSSQGNPNIAHDLHALVDHLINQDAGIIAGRQVLSELVKGLTSTTIPDTELRKAIVEDVLSVVQLRATSYEEQVCAAQPKGLSRH